MPNIPVEELAQELHEAQRKSGSTLYLPWEMISEGSKEYQRNFAKTLLKRVNVRSKKHVDDFSSATPLHGPGSAGD